MFCLLTVRILSKLDEQRHRFILIFGMASLVILVLSSISLRSEFGEQVTALAGFPKALIVFILIPIFNHPIEGVRPLKRILTASGFAFGSVALVFMLYGLFEPSRAKTVAEYFVMILVAGCYAAWIASSYEIWRKVAVAKTKLATAAVASYILLALAIFTVYLILVVEPR